MSTPRIEYEWTIDAGELFFLRTKKTDNTALWPHQQIVVPNRSKPVDVWSAIYRWTRTEWRRHNGAWAKKAIMTKHEGKGLDQRVVLLDALWMPDAWIPVKYALTLVST